MTFQNPPSPPTQVCVRHPDRPTGLACSRCGRPACPQCLTPAAVGQHCVDCVRASGRDTPRATVVGPRGIGSKTPWATYVLLAVNIAVFVATVAQAGSFTEVRGSRIFYEGALFGPFLADGEYWRLLTAGFLHFSLIHVAVNMFSLYILGRDVEITLGTARFVGIYLASLLGGSAMVMLFENPNAINAGASGAIFGLMGATLVVVLRAKVPAGFVLGVIGLNIVLSLTIPNISLWAHLGGLVFGAAAAAGVLYGPGLLPARSRTARNVAAVGWASIAGLIVLALLIGVVRAATLTA